jgi:ribosomal protein S18 acetylase RimI-like enzyme
MTRDDPAAVTWRLAPVTAADTAEVVSVVNAALRHAGRPEEATVGEYEAFLGLPSVDRTRDARLLLDGDGAAVGTLLVECSQPFRSAHLNLAMAAHQHRAAGLAALVDEGVAIARSRPELGPQVPAEVGEVPEGDALARRVLEDRGFREVRRICEMRRTLDDLSADEPTPAPDGIRLGAIQVDDDALLSRLAEVDQVAFADHDGDYTMTTDDFVHMVRALPTSRPDLSVVAFTGSEPVGLTFAMADSSDPSGRTGYVATVAVLRQARGRGVARALLRETFRRYRREGWTTARLHVQLGNRTGADRLYRTVGMVPGPVDLCFQRPLG